MAKHFITSGFAVVWLTVGSTVQAGFIVASEAFEDSFAATSSAGNPPANNSEQENDSRLPKWQADALAPGQSGTGMSGSSYDAPTGPSFSAIASVPAELSTPQIRQLIVESQSRPPTPYLTGVFRPPRFVCS